MVKKTEKVEGTAAVDYLNEQVVLKVLSRSQGNKKALEKAFRCKSAYTVLRQRVVLRNEMITSEFVGRIVRSLLLNFGCDGSSRFTVRIYPTKRIRQLLITYTTQGLTFAQGTEFHPLQPVSRQEFADMLYRLTPSLHPTEMKTEEDALAVLAQNKIMQKGSAEAALTRAEYEAVKLRRILICVRIPCNRPCRKQTAGSDTVSRLKRVRSVYSS